MNAMGGRLFKCVVGADSIFLVGAAGPLDQSILSTSDSLGGSARSNSYCVTYDGTGSFFLLVLRK